MILTVADVPAGIDPDIPIFSDCPCTAVAHATNVRVIALLSNLRLLFMADENSFSRR
jgi:hypothetical protein